MMIVLYFRFIGRNIADRTQQMEQVILTKSNSRWVRVYTADLLQVGLRQNKDD